MDGEIVIRVISEDGKTANAGTQQAEIVEQPDEAAQKSNTSVVQTSVMALALQRGAKQLKNITIGQAKYQLNRYFMMTDDYMASQKMNIALGIVNKGVEFGTAIVAGAMYGGWVGALVAAGVETVSTVIQVANNYNEENFRLKQMDAQLSYNRQRAGYSLTAGSIGENR